MLASSYIYIYKSTTYLILWQSGKGFNDASQGHLALLGQIGGAGEGVGGAAHEPGTGIAWDQQKQLSMTWIL